MISKKIAKHRLILERRLYQNSTLKSISAIDNQTLKHIVSAFKAVKNKSYTKEDLNAFSRCENYRNNLLKDSRVVTYEIFSLNQTALVSDICKKAASKAKWCEFLYMIAKHINNPKVLEIGTNLGVSGAYILEAINAKDGYFVTIEGLPKLCEIASQKFGTISHDSNFEVVEGLYDDTFPKVMNKNTAFNLLFIDGNHKKTPTLEYFNTLKSKISSPALFVFDDIYWSNEMKEAWQIIINDNDVNFSIDLYEQGLVVIDKNETLDKKHFELHLSY
ncbi:methyltransferase family protein [Jejuia pallidilutea]|uniref:Methyltransferase family protein n=1 Tax=Jejuia pallidilutea TaxID=504487 RepID=A0A362WXI6_9FLAO|nr:class I SAM-dependent methyltransferase [Jejuia pallidilutea]PQV45700.1 methyltransferase family protein [Jejuia pallidilutea]